NRYLNRQLAHIQRHAQSRDYHIAHRYLDENTGVSTFRQALHQLEADARLSRYRVLVVYHPSRLFREADKALAYVKHLEALGITVEFVTGVGR
ncbi:recombinase family protein, partial [Chloroflexota bacterium]